MESRRAGGVWEDNICKNGQKLTFYRQEPLSYNSELLVVLSNPHRDASVIPSRPTRGRRAVAAAQAAVAGQQKTGSLRCAAMRSPFLIKPRCRFAAAEDYAAGGGGHRRASKTQW